MAPVGRIPVKKPSKIILNKCSSPEKKCHSSSSSDNEGGEYLSSSDSLSSSDDENDIKRNIRDIYADISILKSNNRKLKKKLKETITNYDKKLAEYENKYNTLEKRVSILEFSPPIEGGTEYKKILQEEKRDGIMEK